MSFRFTFHVLNHGFAKLLIRLRSKSEYTHKCYHAMVSRCSHWIISDPKRFSLGDTFLLYLVSYELRNDEKTCFLHIRENRWPLFSLHK